MHAWEQIQITIDYIEKHLSEDIKINDLAKLAALSQFYYQRLFSRLVKRPVNEYIKMRRLAKASEALQNKDKRILDIALELTKDEYIVCSFEAEDFEHLVMDAVYKAHKYLFETWLPNHNLISKPFAAERYANHSPETTSMEIWIVPVPKV